MKTLRHEKKFTSENDDGVRTCNNYHTLNHTLSNMKHFFQKRKSTNKNKHTKVNFVYICLLWSVLLLYYYCYGTNTSFGLQQKQKNKDMTKVLTNNIPGV